MVKNHFPFVIRIFHLSSLAFIMLGTNDDGITTAARRLEKRTCPPRAVGHKCPI